MSDMMKEVMERIEQLENGMITERQCEDGLITAACDELERRG